MKNVRQLCVIVALASFSCILVAQNSHRGGATALDRPSNVDISETARKYLMSHVGTWDVEFKVYMDDTSPVISKGKAKYALIIDEIYQKQDLKGEIGGNPFLGQGVLTWDKNKKRYVSSWIDNSQSGIMLMEGTYDEKTKTLTEYGLSSTSHGDMKMKNVSVDYNEDEFELSTYIVMPDGTEKLSVQIAYKRVK